MEQFLTLIDAPEEGSVTLAPGVFAALRPCGDPEEIHRESEQWDLHARRNLEFVEYSDRSRYLYPIDRENAVVSQGKLIGVYYDSCFFRLDDPSTYDMINHHPDWRKIGSNFIGYVAYTLRPRPHDRILFSEDKTELLSFPKHFTGRYTIPAHVRSIGDGAFAGCQLEAIHLPDTLEHIGLEAFRDCANLAAVRMDKSFPGEDFFLNCRRPKSVTVPAGMWYGYAGLDSFEYIIQPDHQHYASVDGVVFSKDRTSLIHYPRHRADEEYAVPEGVTLLDQYAITMNPCLRRLRLPVSLEAVKNGAIGSCKALEEVTFCSMAPIPRIIFGDCPKLKRVYLPQGHPSQIPPEIEVCYY